MNPLITVITVVRNSASNIRLTIESVLNQSYPNIEYIVVDGLSDDGTTDIIRQYESRISKWYSGRDGGIADAFNKGAKLAGGEAVIYMNAGDLFMGPDSLESMVAGAPPGVKLSESVLYGDALIIFPTGTKPQHTDHLILRSRKQNSICHQSALIGATIQRQNPYDQRLRTAMDLDLWLRCLSAGVSFHKVPVTVSRYLAGGVSGKPENAARAAIERGLVRIINDQAAPSAWSLVSVMLDAIKADAKHKFRQRLGVKTYAAAKRVLGRSTLEGPL